MVQKINKSSVSSEEGAYITKISAAHNVHKITAEFSSVFSGNVTVRYAQNGITSELILLTEKEIKEDNKIEISLKKPIAASHIYIMLSDPDINVCDINVYGKSEHNSYYPKYKDIDLKENYYLDNVSVLIQGKGYCHYSVYTSMNGRDFDLLAEKMSNESNNALMGDVYKADGREARVIRVYLEYNSDSAEANIGEIRFEGVKSNTQIQEYPKIDIPDFCNSEYNTDIAEQDTYDEVYGIIERKLGKTYKSWFCLEISDNPKEGHTYDYFELKDKHDKIQIKANNGVSLATGLNYYLKYYCNVNISQVGCQTKMPQKPVKINKTIFKETHARVRYAYNYCTHSYSMAFWDEKEWRDELDWLALNGVNVVLDITAQEEVWRRFLHKIGYSHNEIKKYIAGPAYYAWAYMANLYGFGGPVHDSWFSKRTTLARRNHLVMRKLGMYPVLQGYSGMIPADIEKYDKEIDVIPQGTWCSFERPYMIRTTSVDFKNYASLFYEAQKEVYGTYSIYYATDPFHEGGITADLSLRDVSREVLSAMLKSDPDAVWIIQSWQGNPTSELLAGLDNIEKGKQHALILDLYAEKTPHYNEGCANNPSYGYTKEFDQTPWIFCMLNNFGGRLGLHGHLDNLVNWIPDAFNNCEKIAGIGITPEASFNNPVLYDFFFESIWQKSEKMEIPDIDSWLEKYTKRRYGIDSKSLKKAWMILKQTVYKAEYNNRGQGAPESIINARPAFVVNSASAWGNAIVGYDKKALKKALKLLLEDYELLKDSEGYRYDLITVILQVLSNNAQDIYVEMIKAYNKKDTEQFIKFSEHFLNIIDYTEKVTGSSEYFMLGRWIKQAEILADGTDDFTKKIYHINAKALITTWGSYNQSETGMLHDYSNRQWSGLTGDFYKARWKRWIDDRINELRHKPYKNDIDWFEWEWKWVRETKEYLTVSEDVDLYEIAKFL